MAATLPICKDTNIFIYNLEIISLSAAKYFCGDFSGTVDTPD